jgi:hypothetical protein
LPNLSESFSTHICNDDEKAANLSPQICPKKCF